MGTTEHDAGNYGSVAAEASPNKFSTAQGHSSLTNASSKDHPEHVEPNVGNQEKVDGQATSDTTVARSSAPSTSHEKSQNDTNIGPIPSGSISTNEPPAAAPYPNGYHFPPSHTFGHSTKLGMVSFWKYFTTPLGFCIIIYSLNIVAWGGMLFLLLCNAAPAMCHPSCNHIDSPRRKWIEWDSQILNALFCVTGFGLAPWRFRDLYFLLQYRLRNDSKALRRLAGIHRGWFRLPGSESVPVDFGPQNVSQQMDVGDSPSVPFPASKIPDPPLTGVRAPPSRVWKLDLVIWLMVWNTFFQICLAAFMWALNRYNRPSWATGLFVALACIVGAAAGYVMFAEGKAIKSVEGVPISQEDLERLQSDRAAGVYHYNNINDKDPEAKAKKKASET